MLDRLFGKKSPMQSQVIGNITTTGGQVQVAQAGGDVAQAMSGENAGQQQGLSGAEVAALLEQLMGAIASSSLTVEQKESLQDYLKPTKREAAKEQPDKELMGKNLKNVGETMKNLKETTEAGKTIWATGVDVFKAIGPWVGLAAGWLG
jgi:acyl-coenzyme A thioesterase PaaI-like protein